MAMIDDPRRRDAGIDRGARVRADDADRVAEAGAVDQEPDAEGGGERQHERQVELRGRDRRCRTAPSTSCMNGMLRLRREGARFRVHRARLAQHVHEQIDDEHAREPVEHDRRDDDVAAALGLQIAGNGGPGGAEGGRAEDPERDQQETRQEAEVEHDEGGAEAAEGRLTFAADVEQPGMIGDRDRKPGEDEIRRVEQREAEALARAEAALDQEPRRGERIFADAEHHEPGDEERRRPPRPRERGSCRPSGARSIGALTSRRPAGEGGLCRRRGRTD